MNQIQDLVVVSGVCLLGVDQGIFPLLVDALKSQLFSFPSQQQRTSLILNRVFF